MKDPHDVVIRPIISEKSYALAETNNAYTFEVQTSASKPEIADAIEAIFPNVKVGRVNTLNRKGKTFRNRRNNRMNKRSDHKRAIVTLSEGSIELYST